MASLRPYEIPGNDRRYYLGGGVETDHDALRAVKNSWSPSKSADVRTSNLATTSISVLIDQTPVLSTNLALIEYLLPEMPLTYTALRENEHSVQDCMNLGWNLAMVERGLAPKSLMESYTHEHLPVVASTLDQTTALFSKTFRHTSDNFDGWKCCANSLYYHGSPAIVDETPSDASEIVDPYLSGNDGTIRGGDRAPGTPDLSSIGQSSDKYLSSLFDIFGPTHHTLLLFSDDKEKQTTILESVKKYLANILKCVVVLSENTGIKSSGLPAELVFKDKDGYAYQNYVIRSRTLDAVVVRPDGVIGALVSGADGLRTYFDGIFTPDVEKVAISLKSLTV